MFFRKASPKECDSGAAAPVPAAVAEAGVRFNAGESLPRRGASGKSLSWSHGEPSAVKLRIGPNYAANGHKAPSQGSLYEPIGCDAFAGTRSPLSRVAEMSAVELPPPREGIDDLEAIASSGLPRLIIINVQMPLQASVTAKALGALGSFFSDPSGASAGDEDKDAGWNLVAYFAIKPSTVSKALGGRTAPVLQQFHTAPEFATRDVGGDCGDEDCGTGTDSTLEDVTPACENENPDDLVPAVALFKRFVKGWDTDPDLRRRFKAIGVIDNVDALELPGPIGALVKQFNATPMIVNKTGAIYSGQLDEVAGGSAHTEWLEIDINVHDFPLLARKTMVSLHEHHYLPTIELSCAFVIQGETDEELPEVLCGIVTFHGVPDSDYRRIRS